MINISTLVIGESYEKYLKLLIHSLELNCQDINLYVTHCNNTMKDVGEYDNVKIHTNELNEILPSKKGHFPFFMKNEAIKFASKFHEEGDFFLHVDCDMYFVGDVIEMIKEIKNFNKEGLYAQKNHRFTTNLERLPNEKEKKLFEKYQYTIGEFYIHHNPEIMIWFMEGLLFLNVNKEKIIKFSEKWDEAISIVKTHNLSYRPDRDEIAYSCFENNIDMFVIPEYIKKKYFRFLNKGQFNELYEKHAENINEVYNFFKNC